MTVEGFALHFLFQEDQTFPRPPQTDIPVKEQQQQQIESTTPATQTIEKPLPTSNKSERCKQNQIWTVQNEESDFDFLAHLNRQQQYIQSEEDKQDDIADKMIKTAENLKKTAESVQDIVRNDRKVRFFYFICSQSHTSSLENNRSRKNGWYQYS